MPMILLIDENVPRSVGEYLADRGHTVHYVTDHFPRGTPDGVIAQSGNRMGAIVVTWDHKHFKHLAARAADGKPKYPKLGRISFVKCPENRGVECLSKHIELLEFAHEQSLQKEDKLLIVEISTTCCRFR